MALVVRVVGIYRALRLLAKHGTGGDRSGLAGVAPTAETKKHRILEKKNA